MSLFHIMLLKMLWTHEQFKYSLQLWGAENKNKNCEMLKERVVIFLHKKNALYLLIQNVPDL